MIKDIIGPHRSLLLICIAASFVLYMVAAWHSAIYLHPDEHYQIVEFASYKMGITHADQLAWEFGEKIRPAAQPLLCYTLLKTWNSLSITDHYTQLFLLRVLSGLLSLLAITLLCISTLPQIRAPYQRIFIIASFLFFYPYTYGVHFSSEAWSGSMVMIALSLLALQYSCAQRRGAFNFIAVGALLGLAFLFRFQTALMTIGILGWLFFIKRERNKLLFIILSGLGMVALGSLADHWLYGEWTFVPWSYFDSAFIHKHTDFGDQPFYFFPLFFLIMLTPPIGILVLIALVVFFITQTRTLYAWALLPFLTLHMLVPHKEWRFLYPVIALFPLVVMLAWQEWRERSWPMPSLLLTFSKALVVVFDLAAIIVFIFYADHFLFDQKVFLSTIHHLSPSHRVVVYDTDEHNSPLVLPKGSIPKHLFPIYVLDSNCIEFEVRHLQEAESETIAGTRLICTSATEWQSTQGHIKGHIIKRTLPDMPWIRHIAGEAAYQSIQDNTYYLIEI